MLGDILNLYTKLIIFLTIFITSGEVSAKKKSKITPNGIEINYDRAMPIDEIYKRIRSIDFITTKYLGLPVKNTVSIAINIEDMVGNSFAKVVYFKGNKLILNLSSNFANWSRSPEVLEDIIRRVTACKLGSAEYVSTIPQWFVCALSQAVIHKENYRKMLGEQPLPHLRTLLLQESVPDIKTLLTLETHTHHKLLAAVIDEASYVLLLALTSDRAPISLAKKRLFTNVQGNESSIQRLYSLTNSSTPPQLQQWFRVQIEHRTITSRYPAPASFTEKRLNEIENITYTTKDKVKETCTITDLESLISQLETQELHRIKFTFLNGISRLGDTSNPELSEVFSKILKLQEDFTENSFDDFKENYQELQVELEHIFSRYKRIEQLLQKAEEKMETNRRTFDYLKDRQNIAPPIPAAWPALERHLDEIEKAF